MLILKGHDGWQVEATLTHPTLGEGIEAGQAVTLLGHHALFGKTRKLVKLSSVVPVKK